LHDSESFSSVVLILLFSYAVLNPLSTVMIFRYWAAPVRWHTGDPGTSPWEWRIRVLDERDDIAYPKRFYKKSGYITKHCL